MNIAPLVEALRDGSLIAFIGAGVSRPYKDPASNRQFPGIAAANDLLRKMRESRPHLITENETFPQACFLLRVKEGRVALEKFLLAELEKPTLKPLPAHTLCANLPFSAYVTTNYDTLLERALTEARRSPHAILIDQDVTRLAASKAAVIKIHGCVSRPGTMIAAEDEYIPLAERHPIVEALMKALLANKTVVFLGFSLQDRDFEHLYGEVHRMLGQHMPRSYAVALNTPNYLAEYWKAKGVTIYDQDLTAFLKDLVKQSSDQGAVMSMRSAYHPHDDWVNDVFFSSLVVFRSLPSETQVIDAFLNHLLTELRAAAPTLLEVLARARRALDLVLTNRPNYAALQKMGKTLLDIIENECGNSKDDAELRVHDLINGRSNIAVGIRGKSPSLIRKGNNILIYSQSVRVLEFLRGAPRGVQDTCRVYIAECRPKSPESFQDALSIAESLKDTGYPMTLIPDAAIGNLIARNQIHICVVGAHAVYLHSGKPTYFVNTCRTNLLVTSALKHGVPVYVVAETAKFIDITDPSLPPMVSWDEEEALFGGVQGRLTDLKSSGVDVAAINLGYDLCPIGPGVEVVSEA